jgi:hypothetical protein
MTKKSRSPAKQAASPNPRPKQRNRQTSVDRYFALKPASKAKIDEAMRSNRVDSPHASDSDSNNPYDALREADDEEYDEEAPFTNEQEDSDDSSTMPGTQQSGRSSEMDSDSASACVLPPSSSP